MSPDDTGGSAPPNSPDQLFLEHRPRIQRAARHACRRYRFSPQEAEDFLSEVQVKLIEDEYAVLRKFGGGSSISTYLDVVVHNFARDYVNHLWGKWRPCAEAKRLGPDAELLDRLLHRDGMTLHETTETMLHNYKVDLTAERIAEIAERLPARTPRQQVGEEALASTPAQGDSGEDRLLTEDRARLRDRVLAVLREELAKLPAEARLILRLRSEGAKVAQIARALSLDQKALYRSLDKECAKLRAALLARGISEEDVRDLLGWDDWEPE